MSCGCGRQKRLWAVSASPPELCAGGLDRHLILSESVVDQNIFVVGDSVSGSAFQVIPNQVTRLVETYGILVILSDSC
jgi:hypothetical protein